MIFITLGTTKYPFDRPLKKVEELVMEELIFDRIIVQAGYTNFESENLEVERFFSPAQIDKLYNEARIVITHGGTGSIMKGLQLNKKVLVVPRLKKYSEHIDDHQLEVAFELEKKKYLKVWQENENLYDKIAQLQDFQPKLYKSKNEMIISYLASKIDVW